MKESMTEKQAETIMRLLHERIVEPSLFVQARRRGVSKDEAREIIHTLLRAPKKEGTSTELMDLPPNIVFDSDERDGTVLRCIRCQLEARFSSNTSAAVLLRMSQEHICGKETEVWGKSN